MELHQVFGFSDDCITGPLMRRMVGLEIERVPITGILVRVLLRQSSYITTIVRKSMEDVGVKDVTKIKMSRAPMKYRLEPSKLWKLKQKWVFASGAPTHVGRLLWVQRGSRPDLATAVGRIGRHIRDWTMVGDDGLHRLYQYLWETRNLGFRFVIDRSELRLLFPKQSVVSDFADDKRTTKSTSGQVIGLAFPRSWAALSWYAKGQGSTARSTADAETTALDGVVFTAIAPL